MSSYCFLGCIRLVASSSLSALTGGIPPNISSACETAHPPYTWLVQKCSGHFSELSLRSCYLLYNSFTVFFRSLQSNLTYLVFSFRKYNALQFRRSIWIRIISYSVSLEIVLNALCILCNHRFWGDHTLRDTRILALFFFLRVVEGILFIFHPLGLVRQLVITIWWCERRAVGKQSGKGRKLYRIA